MTARLSKTQLAALEKLADGQRRSLMAFTTNTQRSLCARGMIELVCGGTRRTAGYRITDAGRVALNAGK